MLAGRGWHPGVIGIVAGRIKEKTGKPALVIALDDDDAAKGKGSGPLDLRRRSRRGDHRRARGGLLVAGGGHAMAAGLTVAADKLEALAEWLDERLGADVVARASAEQPLLLDLALAPGGLDARRWSRRSTAPGRSASAGRARASRSGRCA